MASILNIMKCKENTYIRFKTTEKDDIILYLDYCMIFIPTCIRLEEMELINKQELQNVNKDIEVKFKVGNQTKVGWLTDSNVIINNKQLLITPRIIL